MMKFYIYSKDKIVLTRCTASRKWPKHLLLVPESISIGPGHLTFLIFTLLKYNPYSQYILYFPAILNRNVGKYKYFLYTCLIKKQQHYTNCFFPTDGRALYKTNKEGRL